MKPETALAMPYRERSRSSPRIVLGIDTFYPTPPPQHRLEPWICDVYNHAARGEAVQEAPHGAGALHFRHDERDPDFVAVLVGHAVHPGSKRFVAHIPAGGS